MIQAGWAEKDITPLPGIPLGGYFNPRWAEKVLDPLKLIALYLEKGDSSLAIVSLDLLAISSSQVKEWKKEISSSIGILPENVLISTTHTHTAPLTFPLFGQKPDWGYVESLRRKLLEALLEAKMKIKPVHIEIATGKVEGISFNRRYRMKNGKVVTNPPKDHPDIVGPAGPVDRRLTLIRILPEENSSSLFLIHFALHLDTVNHNFISSDFVGVVREILKKIYGEKTFFLYLQGTAGDINHLDPEGRIKTSHPYNRIRIGRVLAGEILKLAEFTRKLKITEIKGVSEELKVNLRVPEEKEVEEAKIFLQKFGEEDLSPLTSEDLAAGSERAKAFYARQILELKKSKETTAEMEIQGLKIGELALVGIPAEVFTETGLKIKEKSPFPYTLIVELANGCLGYLPPPKAFEEGGYETMLNSYNRLPPDTEEKVLKVTSHILNQLL